MLRIDKSQYLEMIVAAEKKGLATRTFRRLDPERQQAVVQAILEEAGEKGPSNLNIKEVARRAGVSVGSLYQYFGSRQGVLAFAIELVVQTTVALFNSLRPYLSGYPLREALEGYLLGGLQWGQELTGFVRFFAAAAYHGDASLSESVVRPVASAMRAAIHDLLAAANQRGELRPGVDLEAAGRVVNALTIAVSDPLLLPYLNVYFQVTGEDMPPERMLAAAVDLAVRGLCREERA